MRGILDAAPSARPDLLRDMLAPTRDMYRYFPGEVDLASMHRQSFGFPLEGADPQLHNALDGMAAADVWRRAESALAGAAEVLAAADPRLSVPDITVLIVLGDPTDAHFMSEVRGTSGNGSVTGFITITLWPTRENLDRIEAAVVHELHHNLRYAPGGVVWNPMTVTVGEHVVSEGLADAFARQLYGTPRGYTPFALDHLDDDGVFQKVLTGLDVTGMQEFAAWVLGDATARRFGGTPVGLPTGAGYAAGNRLVDTYLAATGLTAAKALHADADDIIAATR
jgi:uncharacterized protein YjaZ